MVVEFIETLTTGQEGAQVLAEIDISEESGLAGRTIHDVLHACRTIVVLGLQRATGQMQVGPQADTTLGAGDKIIVMGEEEELETIRPASRSAR